MTIQTVNNIFIVILTLSNLGAVGLELNVREAITALRNPRFVVLCVVWGWVVGPAFAYLITRVLPLAEPYVMGLLLVSLAPCAGFLPMVVRKARGDVAFAAAFVPLTAIGTVVLMPLIAPLLIKGLTVSPWAIAKPLLTLVLIPLVIGIAIRVYAAPVAAKLFPVVKWIAEIATWTALMLIFELYHRGMLDSVGSYGIGSMILFFVGMTLVTYRLGFGLRQEQRSVMALGMGTRNIAVVFAALLAFPNPDARLVVMVVLVIPLAMALAIAAARFFASRAGATGAAGEARP